MKNMDEGKKICSFLEKKLALFSQYLSITERMRETIINNKEDNLAGFFKQRQDYMNKIDKIDRSIEETVKAYGEHFKYVSNQLRGSIDSYIQYIRRVMDALAPIEREVMVMVKAESERVKMDLLRRRNVRNAVKGYRNDARYSARFLDTRK